MPYNEKILTYAKKRDRYGQFEDTKDIGVGYVGNAACGDMLKVYLKVGKNKIIEDIRVKTYGCGCAIASTVLAAEKLVGKSLDEARLLTNQEIADELELPGVKKHCSVLAESAIKNAVENYQSKQCAEHDDIGVDCAVNNGDCSTEASSDDYMSCSYKQQVGSDCITKTDTCNAISSEVQRETHNQNSEVQTNTKSSQQAFTITPAAHKRFSDILLSYPGALGVIIGSQAGGCAGNSYYLDVAQEEQTDAKVYELDGLRVFIPKSALMFILGVTIDYEETATQAGFKFTHPGLKSCGCGESFR